MKWLNTLLDKAIERRIRKSAAPLGGWQPKQIACWTCKISHTLPLNIRQALASAEGFFGRHEGHEINWLERPGLAGLWTPNADVKIVYAASAAYTISLASLASSGSLIAGQQSTTISNATNLFDDYIVGGKITNGTTPTVDTTIEVWVFGSVDDTPTYPDAFAGTDAARSVTSVNVKKTAVRLIDRMVVDAVTARVNWFGPVGIAARFDYVLPKNHGLWVTHACVAALNATAGNHVLSYQGRYFTVI